MTDPLSISASVAGLITIADIVIRNGYKYIKAAKNVEMAVASLMNEVNLLSGTLHSLRNVAEGLESESVPFRFTTQVHHVEYCYQTLRKINDLLDSFELPKAKGLLHSAAQRLRWPLSLSETKQLMAEVERHRATLSLALHADGMSALLMSLARQDTNAAVVSDIHRGLNRDRAQRNLLATNEQRKKELEWLCPASIDPAKNHESNICLRQPGTGVWFTDGVEFQEWKLKKNSKLWLYGIPGAGKTLLISTVIQELEKVIGKNEGLAFFYCDYKNTETQDISKILGSLVKQFVLQDETETAFEALGTCYKNHQLPSPRLPKSETLLGLLHEVTRPFSAAAVIIDGLDEISRNRSDAMEILQHLNQPFCAVKTLFASRSEIDIEQYLTDYEQISIAARSSDLELYVASEIETRTRKKQLSIKDSDLKAQIMKRLINGADGMFRWVACQIDHLCELGTDKARRNALDKLPRGLPKTYERILGRVLETHEETQDLVTRALKWLAFGKKPLPGKALLEALALSPGDSRLDSEAMTSEEDILKWCSSLVRRRVDGDGLELAHFTVKEYLVSIDRESDPRFGKFKISETESELLLGSICLTYLTLDTLAGTPLPVDIFDGIYTDSEEMGDSDDAQSEDSTEGEASDEKLQESNDEQYLNGRQQNKKDELNCDNEETDEDTKSAKVSYGSPDIVFDRYLDAYPLLLYAANYWDSHCWLHLRDQTIVSLTHKLFHPQKSNQFLWWSYTYLCDAQRDQWREMFSNTTTLHWAALLGIEEVCAWLVQEGSDVTRGSSLGTPLDCLLLGSTAIWHFDLDSLEDRYWEEEIQLDGELCARASIVDLFIEAGLMLNETSNNDPPWLPLELALVTNRNNDDLIALLLQAGAKVDLAALGVVERYLQKSNQSDINCDIPRGYLTLFENITAKDVQENAREEFSKLSKQLAGRGLQKLELHEVLEHQDASTIVDVDRLQTWFFQAMEHGQGNDIATLITALRQYFTSAEAESTLSMGLRIAAYDGHESIVEGLLKSCVNPNKVGEDGDSALHCSLSEYNDIDAFVTIRIMKTLVAHGADLTLRNKNGELPLHLAAKSKKKGILKAVFEAMENHAAQTMLDSSSPSVLQYAVETGLDDSISYLLEIYDDIDQNKHRSEKGISLLGTAAQRRSPVALRGLLGSGLSTEALDADGSSAIYNAVAHGQLETFKALMEFGATDTSSRDDGRRAIHAAAETHFGAAFQMLEDLLHVGEDPNATTKKGYTPLQLVLPVPNRAFTQQSARKIKLLTEQSGINITCRDHQGRTPLMLCLDCLVVKALKGEETRYVDEGAVLDSIRVILDHGTDLNLVDAVGRTALHYACQAELTTVSFGAIEMLVNRGSVLCHRSEAGITPFELLFNHCVKRLDGANGSVPSTTLSANEVLRFTIEHMPAQHLNDHLSNGLPALANALKLRCADAVELLLSKEEVDVDAKSQDKDQVSSLEIAAGYGCSEAVARTLLHRSSRPTYSLSPIQGYTILHFAVQERSSQTCLRMLLEDNKNLDLEVRDRHGHTPLGVAVTAGCLAAVLLLLKAGADVNNPSPNSETRPLDLAAGSGSLSILDILIQHKAELNLSGPMGITPLIIAASKGFDQVVRSLVKAGVDITHRTKDGTSALIAATLNEHWATSNLLLAFGTNVNYLSPTPWRTILHLTSQRGPWKLIQLLLRMGADQEALDCEGATPFLTSAIARRWDIVSQYLAHGTNFNAKSFSGLSAMHIALQAGMKEAVKLLHRHGAPLLQEIRDQQGTLTGNSLTCAVQSGNLGVFQIISKEGAVLDFESDEGWKIAHYAVLAQDGPVRELLLSYNIDWKPCTATFRCDTLNVVGASPLHLAAVQGRNASINFLKNHGFIQNIDTPTGLAHCYTPLHLATISRNVSTVTLLLEVGANADVVDGLDEKTALHHAAELGLADVVATLLKHGCHPNMLDSHGMTPELLAIENGHLDVTKMLAQHLDALEGQNGATTDTKSERFALTTTTTTTASVTTPWRLPLPRGPYVRKVLTGDVSIYAVDNAKCPPALQELLEQHEGKEVDRLGTPCKRRIT